MLDCHGGESMSPNVNVRVGSVGGSLLAPDGFRSSPLYSEMTSERLGRRGSMNLGVDQLSGSKGPPGKSEAANYLFFNGFGHTRQVQSS